jgi:hypothetical protein
VPATDLHVVMVDQQDPRLGRQCVQDPRSRAFPMAAPDTSTWRSKTIRMYDPTPNPNQTIGDCTGCDKAMEGNAAGNRVSGRVLTMADAEQVYSLATELDPWDGSWPPTDTGSSGLAACKAAIQLKIGGAYRWNFTHDASGIVQEIMEGRTVGVGTDHPDAPGGVARRRRRRRHAGDDPLAVDELRIGGPVLAAKRATFHLTQ